MNDDSATTIRDYTFRETITCPLRLHFLKQEGYNDRREDLFRRKTKRLLRESLALQYLHIHFTSNRTEHAIEETTRWLKEDTISICGAVILHGSLRARIPILLKEKDCFTLIQIHGKAVSRQGSSVFDRANQGKAMKNYLLKAAYRYHVVQSAFPDKDIRCKFLFPVKSYKADTPRLFRKTQGMKDIDEPSLEALKNLFTEAEGTKYVRDVLKRLPSGTGHAWFRGDSLEEAIKKVQHVDVQGGENIVENVHLGCRNCAFRKPVNRHEEGCWDQYFPESDIENRHLHLFELMGHHVQEEHLQVEKFQEKVSYTGGFSDAGKVIHHTGQKISMYHRKAMQLLDAKNQRLPLVIAKNLVTRLTNLQPPLHFIDFEAATHPVPDEPSKRPYDPVLFQFSCHTLTEDGRLVHTQWLDEKISDTPHADLVSALMDIPNLEKGTIVQFSPFERQAFHKLCNEMRDKQDRFKKQFMFLDQVLNLRPTGETNRFVDLSVIIKDGYYNRYMNTGLSLKEILYSVLRTESHLNSLQQTRYPIEGMTLHLLEKSESGRVMDPYYQISDDRCRIRDGISAMHAYLCMKAGALSDEQTRLVPKLLKRYCTLDSLGLFIIFEHLCGVMNRQNENGDVVIDG